MISRLITFIERLKPADPGSRASVGKLNYSFQPAPIDPAAMPPISMASSAGKKLFNPEDWRECLDEDTALWVTLATASILQQHMIATDEQIGVVTACLLEGTTKKCDFSVGKYRMKDEPIKEVELPMYLFPEVFEGTGYAGLMDGKLAALSDLPSKPEVREAA